MEWSTRSDMDNYTDGNINFALEYVWRGRLRNPQLIRGQGVSCDPFEADIGKTRLVHCIGKIGHDLPDHRGDPLCVIPRWNKKLMLVDDVHLMNEVEQIIPTRWTMRFQLSESPTELYPDMLGASFFNSAVKAL